MLVKKVALAKTVYAKNEILKNPAPKIIFCGRSNVGKSSLINFLVRRRGLAKTSSHPGKTASINYYLLNDFLFFVDLPGYGYASLPLGEKKRISLLMESFFELEKNLLLAFLLLDVRIGLSSSDYEMLDLLAKKKVAMLTLLTKSDKLNFNQVIQRVNSLRNELNVEVIPVSVKNQNCRNEIFRYIKFVLEEKQCIP